MSQVVCRYHLFVFICFVLAGCRVELQHALTESQANEMILVLIQEGVNATKSRDEGKSETWLITVPKADTARSLDILIKKELPRDTPPGFQDLFQKEGFIPSEVQQQARYITALSGELQRTLESDDSILKARVHIYARQKTKLYHPDRQSKPSASVYLKVSSQSDPDSALSDVEVQSLVANSVADLELERVSVVRSFSQKKASAVQVSHNSQPKNSSVPDQCRSRMSADVICICMIIGLVVLGVIILSVAIVRSKRTRLQLFQEDSNA